VADLDAVAAFLTADAAEPRAAARPIAARIAAERPEAARLLAEKLLPALYRTEEHEGLRADVYAVLSTDLRAAVMALGPETTWTLLKARSEPARQLGASVLDGFKPTDFSIRQLARIGCNDQVKARRWALAQLQSRIEAVRAQPEEGFALLDCPFDDTREAGYAMYREQLQPEDWTPAALIGVSDAITEPAQRFGREMIGKVFAAKNADVLLSRLAEHPAAGFRLLVARLMRDFVKDDTQRLRQLVPTIETTLLQVRKSRAAKDQVFAFIEEQIAADANVKSGERIAILGPILERTVATCATADRARTLSLLASIKHKNPDLAPRVVIVPREARR
jgi:cellulose synthase operon protein C